MSASSEVRGSLGDRSVGRRFATVADARRVLRRLADDWAEGFGVGGDGSGAGRVSGGGASDPVGARVVGPFPSTDRADEGAVELVEGAGLSARAGALADRIDAWVREGNACVAEILRLVPLEYPVADMLARHRDSRFVGAGVCQRDKVGVSGVGEDRLKAGWCPRCYRQWLRDGRPDRAAFNAGVSPTVGDDETAGASTEGDGVVLLASSGCEMRPDAGAVV